MVSVLFEPFRLGSVEVKNRFVRSATYECMCGRDGRVTPQLIKLYSTLAKGEIGVIITGHMFVSREGRGGPGQIAITDDDCIPGLSQLAETIRSRGSLAVFQINHAGCQTMRKFTGGYPPRAPSGHLRDPLLFSKARPLTSGEIERIIADFARAAGRAVAAGADGIQVHAAHGYLISEFLSPFFNHRDDQWGGSRDNRFRFLAEVVSAVRREIGSTPLLLVKINVNDFTPAPGVTPELAVDYARRLSEMAVDGVEISQGTTTRGTIRMIPGDVPVRELARFYPWPLRWLMTPRIKAISAQASTATEAFPASAAPAVKSALGRVPLLLVGGLRRLAVMEEYVATGAADLVSLCRPFIRQPLLVRRLQSQGSEAARCKSCNLCFAAVCRQLPIRCYAKGLPAT
jgi:2,4-dienoyl-CoA reductase-like NADH-dependent reductase (Old Yellow Enzyme family)